MVWKLKTCHGIKLEVLEVISDARYRVVRSAPCYNRLPKVFGQRVLNMTLRKACRLCGAINGQLLAPLPEVVEGSGTCTIYTIDVGLAKSCRYARQQRGDSWLIFRVCFIHAVDIARELYATSLTTLPQGIFQNLTILETL